jgi:nucleoid-associated protein YgaU
MPQIETFVGNDLYHIAAQYLGDATQWVVLAQLNGITDPFLIGVNTLTIPDPDPSRTGGIRT